MRPARCGLFGAVVAVDGAAGPARLAVGFPAEGRYAELVLDADSRVVEETLVDPKHLTRRRFVYSASR
jgi:hypothetical protein